MTTIYRLVWFCSLFFSSISGTAYAYDIQQIDHKVYNFPVKISLLYTGLDFIGDQIGDKEFYSQNEIREQFDYRQTILNDKKTFQNNPKKFSPLYQNYLSKPQAGKEAINWSQLKLPFSVGYVQINADHSVEVYPTESPAKWYLYVQTDSITRGNIFNLIFAPSGIRDLGKIDCDHGNCGSFLEGYKRGDPDFVPGLIRYFEEQGFRIIKIEESKRLPASVSAIRQSAESAGR